MNTFRFDGRTVAYTAQGSGPLLLVLPGSTASSALHAGELDHFGKRYRAVAIDFPGTGASERIESWPSDWWERCADCAAALVAELGDPSAAVIGTSGGAIVALLMAARRPGLVRAVIADSCVPRYEPDFLRRAVVMRRIETPQMVAMWERAHGPDWRQVVDADGAFLERVALNGGDPLGDAPENVRCPVLFTASLGDDLLRDIGPGVAELVRRVPGSRALIVAQGRHPMIWTRPGEFRFIADAFLAEFDPGTQGPR